MGCECFFSNRFLVLTRVCVCSSLLAYCEALYGDTPRSVHAREKGSLQGEGSLDSNHPLYLSCLLSNPSLRNHVLRIFWSLLLDACDSSLQQRHSHGAGYLSYCDFWTCYATSCWLQNHRSRSREQRGPSAFQWSPKMFVFLFFESHQTEPFIVFGMIITIAQATAYVFSGMYGEVKDLGFPNAFIIILQLFFAGIIVLILVMWPSKCLFVELFGVGRTPPKGLRFGLWNFSLHRNQHLREYHLESFQPHHHQHWTRWVLCFSSFADNAQGTEFEGAIIALFHLLITRGDKVRALKEAFYRQNLPNLTNLLATAVVFLVVIYFQGFRVDLPVKYQRQRGAPGSYPIKLFYTSNIPIILQTALVSNLYFLSQLLYRRFPTNILVNIVGQWQVSVLLLLEKKKNQP